MNRVIVLMTGTINPHFPNFTNNPNPLVREVEYLKSLEYIANVRDKTKIKFDIIFAENSGYKSLLISDFTAKSGIDFIQYNDTSDINHGKGYHEVKLIETCISKYQLVSSSNTIILKLTGRHIVKNINKFITYARYGTYDVSANIYSRLTFADSRLFIFTLSFFPYLMNAIDKISDRTGYYLEHALALSIFIARNNGLIWEYLNDVPAIIGYSGTSGNHFSQNLLKERIKINLYRYLYQPKFK